MPAVLFEPVLQHTCTNSEHVTFTIIAAWHSWFRSAVQYLKYLEKGQAAPTTLSMTAFTVDLTLESDKYRLTVHRTAPDMLRLHLNHSAVDVGARKLSDGSILVQVDGCAHVVHAEKEVTGTRLIIDNLTCLLPNEHDPSSLRAPSPGKLLRHVAHIAAPPAHVQHHGGCILGVQSDFPCYASDTIAVPTADHELYIAT